jgi:hypothetical protein
MSYPQMGGMGKQQQSQQTHNQLGAMNNQLSGFNHNQGGFIADSEGLD